MLGVISAVVLSSLTLLPLPWMENWFDGMLAHRANGRRLEQCCNREMGRSMVNRG